MVTHVIPPGWREVSFGEVVGRSGLFVDGDWVESKHQDPHGDIRLIQLADVGDGEFLNRSCRFLTSETATQLRCTYLVAGDLLVARMPDPLGRACIFPGDSRKCATAVDVCIVRADRTLVDLGWLKWAVNSAFFRQQLSRYTTGTTRQRISRKNLQQIRLILPPLTEQHRIAAILDKANAVRRKRREAIGLLDEFLRSAFLEMFGDPVRNEKGWEVVELGDHLTFITSGSRGWAKFYSAAGARFIRSLDVQMNRIAETDAVFVTPPAGAEADRTRVLVGDVLLTITGSRIGRVAPVEELDGEAYISQHVAILRLSDTICPRYLSMFLAQDRGGQHQIRQAQYGQTKPGLNLTDIRDFRVPVPPLKQQEEFSSVIDSVDSLKHKQTDCALQADALFNSISQRAFRGEV